MEDTMTPMPTGKSVTMNFYDGLKKVIEGKKITRISWGNRDYCFMKDGFLSIYTKGEFHTWSVNDGDMEGTDWCVIA